MVRACSRKREEVALQDLPRIRGDIKAYDFGLGVVIGDGTVWGAARLEQLAAAARGYIEVTALAEKKKHKDKDAACTARGWIFMAFAFNHYGGMGNEMYEYFTTGFEKKRDEAVRVGEPEWKVIMERKNLFEDMACTIQRGNYKMMDNNTMDKGAPSTRRAADVDEVMEQAD